MSGIDFEFLIHLIRPKIPKENINFCDSLSVILRLTINLLLLHFYKFKLIDYYKKKMILFRLYIYKTRYIWKVCSYI